MVKITRAAIKYRLKGETKFRTISARSHAICIKGFSMLNYPASKRDMENEIQGFLTSKGDFVDRIEALKIAKNAKQVKPNYDKKELFSEFLIF